VFDKTVVGAHVLLLQKNEKNAFMNILCQGVISRDIIWQKDSSIILYYDIVKNRRVPKRKGKGLQTGSPLPK